MAKIKGDIVINTERCKGCEVCLAACPFTVIAMSKEVNSKGYHFAMKINETKQKMSDIENKLPFK